MVLIVAQCTHNTDLTSMVLTVYVLVKLRKRSQYPVPNTLMNRIYNTNYLNIKLFAVNKCL